MKILANWGNAGGALGPETRRAVALGILRAALERDPTPEELSAALAATLDETDPARFAEAVLRRVPRTVPPVLLELARSAVMLEEELVVIRSSVSWKLGGALRFGGRMLPPGCRRLLRAAAISAYRSARTALDRVRQNAARLRRGRIQQPACARLPGVPSIDLARAEANAARWCSDRAPAVSFIVINWNAADTTAHCVRNLWQVNEGTPYEILIADNGSAPREVTALSALGPGVRVLPLGINRYFGEANNIAAEQARGEFLCFLNNDAFPRPGWLEPLLSALRSDPEAGAAGPKFLFPNGKLQEAGAVVDARGFPVRFGRLLDAKAEAFDSPREVDYISAAALIMPKALFEAAGGFDLAFEPAYYEDTDLCFRLRLLGRSVRYCPTSEVVHIEGAQTDDSVRGAYRRALGDFNRGKFVARWGSYLQQRNPAALRRLGESLIPGSDALGTRRGHLRPEPIRGPLRPTAGLFTPYALTPGGGERYLLTLASVLSDRFDVTIYTPFPYSQLRLATLGREFGIDVAACRIAVLNSANPPKPDLWIAMGNHVVPSVPRHGRENWYLCQFPFPLDAASLARDRGNIAGYQRLLVYSDYARRHVKAAFGKAGLAPLPVHVIHPPVPILAGDPARKGRMILSVGRFFAGGHAKRHDVLIDAFRELLRCAGDGIELHLAGASSPERANMDYLTQVQTMATGLPVTFHLNPAPRTLRALYAETPVYWHATGYGMAEHEGEKAEHFGISIVEAMSAGCIPVVYRAGGPCDIIADGVSGFLFDSIDGLVETTASLLGLEGEKRRLPIARAAQATASRYSEVAFADAIAAFAGSTAPIEEAAALLG